MPMFILLAQPCQQRSRIHTSCNPFPELNISTKQRSKFDFTEALFHPDAHKQIKDLNASAVGFGCCAIGGAARD